jgi:hypothetical protein
VVLKLSLKCQAQCLGIFMDYFDLMDFIWQALSLSPRAIEMSGVS